MAIQELRISSSKVCPHQAPMRHLHQAGSPALLHSGELQPREKLLTAVRGAILSTSFKQRLNVNGKSGSGLICKLAYIFKES